MLYRKIALFVAVSFLVCALSAAVFAEEREERQGAWVSSRIVGVGLLNCTGCERGILGFATGLDGGFYSEGRFGLGISADLWATLSGISYGTAATVTPVVRFFPSERHGGFLQVGAGAGAFASGVFFLGGIDGSGPAAVLGGGVEIPLRRNLKLTTNVNGHGLYLGDGEVAGMILVTTGLTFHLAPRYQQARKRPEPELDW